MPENPTPPRPETDVESTDVLAWKCHPSRRSFMRTTLVVVFLFLIILLRGMKIARYARDEFGMFLAIGITTTITLYGLVNAGVALGVLPTTGLPMPFVSYGGSSMFFSSIAIGVLLNISSQTDMHPRLGPTADGVRQMDPSKSAVGKVY